MPTITYHDHEQAAPTVTWYGVEFKDGEPVELDNLKITEEQKAEMVLRANASAYYTVVGADGSQESADLPPAMAPGSPPYVPPEAPSPPPPPVNGEGARKAGRAAADAGHKRETGKGKAWLEAFDERMEELEKEAKASKNTHPRR